MLTFRRITLSDINANPLMLETLHRIFQSTLNKELSLRAFKQYYFSQHPCAMDITLMLLGDDVVGFCSAAFYPSRLGNKRVIISRAAIGIDEAYRGGSLPTAQLLRKFIVYKAKHPFTPVCIAGFIANPKVYAMMCKYALQVYPKRASRIPAAILNFKNALLQSMNLAHKELVPFVLKIHFKVALPPDEKERLQKSSNKHIQHYFTLNPQLNGDTGVLVLLPVNALNIVYACLRLMASLMYATAKKMYAPQAAKPVLQTS